jgi:hypothetical protein
MHYDITYFTKNIIMLVLKKNLLKSNFIKRLVMILDNNFFQISNNLLRKVENIMQLIFFK